MTIGLNCDALRRHDRWHLHNSWICSNGTLNNRQLNQKGLMTADLKCMFIWLTRHMIIAFKWVWVVYQDLSICLSRFSYLFVFNHRHTLLSGISNIEILVFVSIMHLLRWKQLKFHLYLDGNVFWYDAYLHLFWVKRNSFVVKIQ